MSKLVNRVFVLIFLAAIDYLLSNPIEPVDVKALEESAGIGVVVSLEDIQRVVSHWENSNEMFECNHFRRKKSLKKIRANYWNKVIVFLSVYC